MNDEPRLIPAQPTPKQRIVELECRNDVLTEDARRLRIDLQQMLDRALDWEDRANAAVEALEQVRKRARVLYDAIYRGKISRAEDILSALDPIVHG